MIWIPFGYLLGLVKCINLSSTGGGFGHARHLWEHVGVQRRLCVNMPLTDVYVFSRAHWSPFVRQDIVLSQPLSFVINFWNFVISNFHGACRAPVPARVIATVHWTTERVTADLQWSTVAHLPHISGTVLRIKWPQVEGSGTLLAVWRRGAFRMKNDHFHVHLFRPDLCSLDELVTWHLMQWAHGVELTHSAAVVVS